MAPNHPTASGRAWPDRLKCDAPCPASLRLPTSDTPWTDGTRGSSVRAKMRQTEGQHRGGPTNDAHRSALRASQSARQIDPRLGSTWINGQTDPSPGFRHRTQPRPTTRASRGGWRIPGRRVGRGRDRHGSRSRIRSSRRAGLAARRGVGRRGGGSGTGLELQADNPRGPDLGNEVDLSATGLGPQVVQPRPGVTEGNSGRSWTVAKASKHRPTGRRP